jgi:hypothetical protein
MSELSLVKSEKQTRDEVTVARLQYMLVEAEAGRVRHFVAVIFDEGDNWSFVKSVTIDRLKTLGTLSRCMHEIQLELDGDL